MLKTTFVSFWYIGKNWILYNFSDEFWIFEVDIIEEISSSLLNKKHWLVDFNEEEICLKWVDYCGSMKKLTKEYHI